MQMHGMSKYLRIEHRLERPLADQLRRWRDARISAPAIARLLELDTGIRISPSAVRLWLRALEDAA